MDYITEYRNKLRTPQEAVKVVKSGDWIDYLTNVAFPELLDAALAAHPRKVVIKRPPKGPYLAGKKPSYSLTGKAIRYDVIAL